MHTDAVTKVITQLNNINRLSQKGIIFWNTLILPICIAIFVTHLLEKASKSEGIGYSVWAIVLVVLILHCFVVIMQYRGSKLDTMITEYQEKTLLLREVRSEFKEFESLSKADLKNFSAQRSALRFAISSLSYAIGKLRNNINESKPTTTEEKKELMHSLIWPLVVYRESLFSFGSGTLWNIALYRLNSSGELVPEWRKNDERIATRNRAWKPGFGVVGMSFLHGKIKYIADISKNDDAHTSTGDKEKYCSIIAIPIIPCEDSSSPDNHDPLGVLVLTSNQAEQFNLDRDAVFLQMYANLASILIEKFENDERATAHSSSDPDIKSEEEVS